MSDAAFLHLGLRPDAGAREVKRAYARLLRDTRPDEDPAGFQALSEAYEYAHAVARAREAAEAGAGPPEGPAAEPDARPARAGDAPPSPGPQAGTPSPAAAEAPPTDPAEDDDEPRTFDYRPFHVELLQAIAHPDPHRLAVWLRRQPALWSVELKRALVPVLFGALLHDGVVPSPGHYGVLLEFFGIDVALHRHPVLAPMLDELEARMRARDVVDWYDLRFRRVRPRPGERPPPPATPAEVLAWAELRGPRQAWRRFRHCALGAGPGRARALLHQVMHETGGRATLVLDPEAVAFYEDAGDAARFGRARLQVLGMRLAALVACWAIASLLLWAGLPEHGEPAQVLGAVGAIALGVLATWLGWTLLAFGLARLSRWGAGRRWFRLSHVTGVGLWLAGLAAGLASPGLGLMMAIGAAMILHLRRMTPLVLLVLLWGVSLVLFADHLPPLGNPEHALRIIALLFGGPIALAVFADRRLARSLDQPVGDIEIPPRDGWHVAMALGLGFGVFAMATTGLPLLLAMPFFNA